MGWKVTTETNDSDKVTSILGEAFQYYADGSIVELDRSHKEDLFFILYISTTIVKGLNLFAFFSI